MDEVNILSTLNCPNIVKYQDWIVDKSNYKIYIIMEYCQNGDLKDRIDYYIKNNQTFDEGFVWKVIAQMSNALMTCHNNPRNKIIHRDIKPGNIFLDKYDNVKLGDFGLSKLLDPDVRHATTNVGTPYYMSPEQVGTEDRYDEKADIWALGVVIYQMWAGQVPFKAKNYLELAQNISNVDCNPLPEQYSEELRIKVVEKLLNKDPKQRPSAIKLRSYSPIREKLLSIKKKEFLTFRKSKLAELEQKEKELKAREEKIKKREQQLDRLINEVREQKKNYEAKLDRVATLSQSFGDDNEKLKFIKYNTVSKDNELKYSRENALSKTIDQGYDNRSSLGAGFKNLCHNSFERLRIDNQENVNTENTNLWSSGSSINQNKTYILHQDSKNLSGSRRFEDSQNELDSSRKKNFIGQKYQSKEVKINLWEDNNSSGSSNLSKYAQFGHPRNNGQNNAITRPSTGDNNDSGWTALSKHIESKIVERSLEFKKNTVTTSINSRLPPSGLNIFQRNNFMEKEAQPTQNYNYEQAKIKRNYSTNNIQNLNGEENSRNRLTNRKSIPNQYKGSDLTTYVKVGNTIQISTTRNHYDTENKAFSADSDLVLNKTISGKIEENKNKDSFKFCSKPDKNATTLMRNNSQRNFTNRDNSNQRSTLQNLLLNKKKKINQGITSNLQIKGVTSKTPRNNLAVQNISQNRFSSRKSTIGKLDCNFINKIPIKRQNSGSITNRESNNTIQNQKVMARNQSTNMIGHGKHTIGTKKLNYTINMTQHNKKAISSMKSLQRNQISSQFDRMNFNTNKS